LKPGVDIALAPTQQPRAWNLDARWHRKPIATHVFFDCFGAASQLQGEFVKV